MSDSEIDYGAIIGDVARALWGEPKHVNSREMRWGSGGAKVVYLDGVGNFKDYTKGDDNGGGVIDLVMHVNGCSKRDAFQWLVDEGFIDQNGETKQRNSPPPPMDDGRPEPPPVEESQPQEQKPTGKWTEFAQYDYTDRDGNLIYQTVRVQFKMPDGTWEMAKNGKAKKTFIQRRPSRIGDDSWVLGLNPGEFMRRKAGDNWIRFDEKKFENWGGGERHRFTDEQDHALYRWAEIDIAISEEKTVFIIEGEKAVDAAVEMGLEATCNSGGASKFHDGLLQTFKEADVVIIPDNDEAGRAHADFVASKLRSIANSVKVLALPGLSEKEDIVEWRAAGHAVDELLDLVDQTPFWKPKPPKSKFGAIEWSEIDGKGHEHDWLIKGLIERRSVGVIAGPSQSGKSFFMVDLALAVAQGREYCGRKTTQGLVLYQAGEGGAGLKKRLRGYMMHHEITVHDDVPFVLMPSPLDLYANDDPVNLFIAEAKEWASYSPHRLELIVIDTLSAASAGANENASEDIGRILKRCNRISSELACTVMLVHHMNAEGKRVRGHTSLGANVANVIEVKLLENLKDQNSRPLRRAELTKNKDGIANVGWKFVLVQKILGQDEDGDDITTCVLDRPAGEDEKEDIPDKRLTQHEQVFYDALLRVLDDFGKPAPSNLPTDVRKVVDRKHWLAEIDKVWEYGVIPGDTDEDRLAWRKAELSRIVRRVGTSLSHQGIIGRDNDKAIVWWTGKDITNRKRAARKATDEPRFQLSEDLKNDLSDDDEPPF